MSVKLLLVFVEYNEESNTLLLLQAIDKVDSQQGVTFLLITCIAFCMVYSHHQWLSWAGTCLRSRQK